MVTIPEREPLVFAATAIFSGPDVEPPELSGNVIQLESEVAVHAHPGDVTSTVLRPPSRAKDILVVETVVPTAVENATALPPIRFGAGSAVKTTFTVKGPVLP